MIHESGGAVGEQRGTLYVSRWDRAAHGMVCGVGHCACDVEPPALFRAARTPAHDGHRGGRTVSVGEVACGTVGCASGRNGVGECVGQGCIRVDGQGTGQFTSQPIYEPGDIVDASAVDVLGGRGAVQHGGPERGPERRPRTAAQNGGPERPPRTAAQNGPTIAQSSFRCPGAGSLARVTCMLSLTPGGSSGIWRPARPLTVVQAGCTTEFLGRVTPAWVRDGTTSRRIRRRPRSAGRDLVGRLPERPPPGVRR
jgi:hypothetical protein